MDKILVVDDEKEIIELIEFYFKDSYEIIKAYDGFQALDKLAKNEISLVIVDLMMPKMDGYTFIKAMRNKSNIPIIILSAKGNSIEKIEGLDIGADDYVSKPFDPLELLARARVQLRRLERSNGETLVEEDIKSGDLILIKDSFSVCKNGENIALTSTEFKILKLLMSNSKKVFTKKNIFESVWQEEYAYDDNAIMVQISKLRDKIEEDSRNPKYIKTIRGLGYRFQGE